MPNFLLIVLSAEERKGVQGKRRDNRFEVGITHRTTILFGNDLLNRTTSITQYNASGATSTTKPKKVFLDYNLLGQVLTVDRESWTGSGYTPVAHTDYLYDQAGRLLELKHSKDSTTFAEFDYLYDLANQITEYHRSLRIDPLAIVEI